MNEKQKREPKEPLHIPLDFEETLEAMLKVTPPPKELVAMKKNAVKKKSRQLK